MAKLRVLLMTFRMFDEMVDNNRLTYTLSLYHLKAYVQSLPDLSEDVEIDLREEAVGDETWVPSAVEAGYDVVGFSCYVWNFLYTLGFMDRLREKMPKACFVLGGPVCYMQEREIDDFFARFSSWDVMVRGEGELPLANLLRALKKRRKDDLDDIPSISFKRNGGLIHNPALAEILQAEDIPSPYLMKLVPLGSKVMHLQTSRGCPYACKFCTMSFIGRNVREFSMKRVAKELAYAKVMGYKEVMSIDASMNLSTERFVQFTEVFKKYALDLTFHMQMEWHLVNEEQIKAMEGIPKVRLNFGIQTLSPGAAWTVGKKNEIDKIIPKMELISAVVVPLVDLILGLPGDTKQGFIRTFDLVFEHRWDIILFHCFFPPGTEIYSRRHEFGVKFDEQSKFALIEHATMTQQDIQDCVDYVVARCEERLVRNQWVSLDMMLPGRTLTFRNTNAEL